jgi:hypothetical protein
MELFFEKKVFLELFVKVEKDWRNKDLKLRSFGYNRNKKRDRNKKMTGFKVAKTNQKR